jgi:hemerythrin
MIKAESSYENKIFPWNSYFEVGVPEIDAQHKKLVALINKICSLALNEEDHNEAVNLMFQELIDYTNYHFDFEEKLYQKSGIPRKILDSHKVKHVSLVTQVTELKNKHYTGKDNNLNLEEILASLVLWLANHILYDDLFMCTIIRHLKNGVSVAEVEDVVEKEIDVSKSNIAKVMIAMINVSNASFKELRKEIVFRRQIEAKLKEEIYTRKEAQKKLEYLAMHDSLTGLPNRLLFEELCELALKKAKRNIHQQATLFIDIDGFKKVNDSLGHKAGDALLVSIAERLKACIRESDVVARIGGDEFVVHLGENCTEENSKKIASQIVESISKPFVLKDGEVKVSASIGISIYPKNAKSAEELLKMADNAMYVAKRSGKNTYKLYA